NPTTGEAQPFSLVDGRCIGVPAEAPRAVTKGVLYLRPSTPAEGVIHKFPALSRGTYLLGQIENLQGDFVFRTLAAAEHLLAVNEKEKEVSVQASAEPPEMHVFKVSFGKGRDTQMTRAPGIHSAAFPKNSSAHVLTSTTLDKMPRSTVHNPDGKLIGELPSV